MEAAIHHRCIEESASCKDRLYTFGVKKGVHITHLLHCFYTPYHLVHDAPYTPNAVQFHSLCECETRLYTPVVKKKVQKCKGALGEWLHLVLYTPFAMLSPVHLRCTADSTAKVSRCIAAQVWRYRGVKASTVLLICLRTEDTEGAITLTWNKVYKMHTLLLYTCFTPTHLYCASKMQKRCIRCTHFSFTPSPCEASRYTFSMHSTWNGVDPSVYHKGSCASKM